MYGCSQKHPDTQGSMQTSCGCSWLWHVIGQAVPHSSCRSWAGHSTTSRSCGRSSFAMAGDRERERKMLKDNVRDTRQAVKVSLRRSNEIFSFKFSFDSKLFEENETNCHECHHSPFRLSYHFEAEQLQQWRQSKLLSLFCLTDWLIQHTRFELRCDTAAGEYASDLYMRRCVLTDTVQYLDHVNKNCVRLLNCACSRN